ncbi:MAG: aminopeptidase N [Gammaproteobacteria bacterium]
MNKDSAKVIHLADYQVPEYLIEKVDLEFELGEAFTLVKSRFEVKTNPESKKKGKDLILVGEALELKSIALDGKRLEPKQYRVTDETLTIPNVPSAFILEIHTHIKPQENTELSGLYKSSGNFCTQCEAEGFRRITYFLDRPDNMASYTTTIIGDEKRYPILLSNGNLIGSGKLDKNRHWATWEDPFKKPSYLFALVAGDLEFIEDFFETKSGKRVTLRIFVEKGNKDKCDHAMQAVKKAMRWDEEKYGREYDLDIYMIVAVSDFNMGAMENKGLNIFNTKYILARPETATDQDYIHVESVVAHEYFHNWTGNRITCRDWFQLSLKEGLTVFRDQSFTADTTSKTVARIQDVNALRTAQFPEDAGPLAHPVRPESYIEINNFYTATVYEKGAELIRMMHTILGPELFRKGMDLYFERHDGQAVTTEEFVAAMEDASQIDLKQFRLWYSQAGTPVLQITDEYDAIKKVYTLEIKQIIPDTPGQKNKKPMHIPVKIGLLDESGNELTNQLLQLRSSIEKFEFENITAQPIPSLLREFSAPVKVQYAYSDAALLTLFKYDTDEFNRWEAGQKYALNFIMRMIKEFQKGKKLHLSDEFVDGYIYALQTVQDKLLLTEMLMLPSEKYIAEQMQTIDVDAIHAVREFILHDLAKQLKNLLINYYQKNHKEKTPYQFSMQEVGKRQLKNICLSYLMSLNENDIHENMGLHQFERALANNMTDTLAALRALANINGPQREAALKAFYEQWQNDTLVVDKWFAVQATAKLPKTLGHVKKLMQHPAFDIKNPNKVYSLIGAFCNQNPVHFHASNGEGYEFLASVVDKLNTINPQIAARMVTPLTQWRRYDSGRQALMKKQLEGILQNKNLSKDVYEIVNKSLHE